MSRARLVVNVALFQAAWFAAVLGAARGLWWVGPACAVVALGAHLALAPGGTRGRELAGVLAATAAGAAGDLAHVALGGLTFAAGAWPSWGLALWLAGLWAAFATGLTTSLAPLRRRPLLLALLGLVGAPASYWAGERLGAAGLGPSPVATLAIVGAQYAALTPALAWMASRIMEGGQGRPARSARGRAGGAGT